MKASTLTNLALTLWKDMYILQKIFFVNIQPQLLEKQVADRWQTFFRAALGVEAPREEKE